MSKPSNTKVKARKKSLDLKTRFQAISSDKKLPYEEQFPRNAIYNSEKKNPIEKNSSEAKQILNSWLKNEKEAYAIKEKSINNSHIIKNKPAGFFHERKKSIPQSKKDCNNGKIYTKSTNSSFWFESNTPISNTNRSNREIVDKSTHNISFDLKDNNKIEFINKVYSIQNKVKPITALTMKTENTEKNIEEIARLKNKRKDLEKQTQKMEKDMQKLTDKFSTKTHNNTDKKQKEMDSAIDLLRKEHEKSRKLYLSYKGEKFNDKLSHFFITYKRKTEKNIYFLLKELYFTEKNKILQMRSKINEKLKKNCYILWHEIIIQEKEDRKRKEKLKEDLREEFLQKKADKLYQKNLCKRIFMFFKIQLKTLHFNKNSKKPSKSKNIYKKTEIKSKINNFITEIKKKTTITNANRSKSPLNDVNNKLSSPKTQMLNKSNHSDILIQSKNNEISNNNEIFNQSFGCNNEKIITAFEEKQENFEENEKNMMNFEDYEEYEEECPMDQIITNIPKPICFDNFPEQNQSFDKVYEKKNSSPLSKNTEKTSAQTPNKNSDEKKNLHKRNFSSQKEKEKDLKKNNPPKIRDLEDRAKKRKENLNVIKQKHQEKLMQKALERRIEDEKKVEEEKQKAIEYKQKIQQKKKEEIMKKESKEQTKEREARNLEKAVIHHKKALKKFYVFYPLKKAIQRKRDREIKAEKLYQTKLMRYCFEAMNEAITLIKIEKNIQISKNLEKAKLHYEHSLKSKSMNGFLNHYVESFEEAQKYCKKRNNYLLRLSFFSWFKLLPRLREKKLILDGKYDKIVKQFRFVILADRTMRAWKQFCSEEKKEKVKKSQKDVMWKKVNGWLSEYSEQKKHMKYK